jgi:hypothetical protein
MRNIAFSILLVCLALSMPSFAAEESVQSFVFEGRAYDSSDNPMLDASVDFNFKIYNPAKTCLLYEENQIAVNLSASNGFFALAVGSKIVGGGKRAGLDPSLSMSDIFQNKNAVTGAAACVYTPTAGDARVMVVTMDPSIGGPEVFPDVPVNAVPLAMVAESIQGILPTGLVNVAGNVTQANMATLTGAGDASALHHHNSLYMQIGATVNMGNNSYVSGNFGINTSSPQGDLGFGGTAARTIVVNRNTAGVGQDLTMTAGGAQTAQSDVAGGKLILSSGVSTGSAGSTIEFKTATPAASGTADNTPSTKMTITAAGRVGIGTTNPLAWLHLPASTTGVASAPIKLSTGVLMTMPEAGAIEYDGANLYYTNSTPARRTLATTSDLAGYIKADGTVAFTADQSMGTHKLTNVVDPTAAQDAATRAYVLSTAGNYLPLTGGTLTGNLTGRASTTAAGTAPIKLPTGVLMTAPEAGAIEYDGTNLYYTNSGGARQTLSTGAGASGFTDGGTSVTLTTATDSVGLGLAPTAALTLRAGAAAAGGAPLKLTQGTNLTAAEAGAIEFDGTNLYFTDSTPTRRTIATTTGLGSYLPLAGGTMTGSITGRASTTAAGTSPIKYGRGVLMTAPEEGAIEFDGANLYFTDSTPTRRTVATTTALSGYLPLTGGTLTGNLTGRASTTAAGTAPLKLATGVLMTTPEAGAIEYDGASLYYTNSGGARQTIATGAGSSGWTDGGTAVTLTTGTDSVGVGVAPTAALTLRAGAAAASGAPLKLTAGTNLTAAEAGAIEFDGTNLYFTDSTPTRRTLATTTGLGSYLPLAGGTMSGAIAMGTSKITGLGDPTLAQDAATRAYVLSTAGNYLPLAGGTMTGSIVGRASTTAAGTSPIKYGRGVLMTAPEEGAIEFDGANLYYTNSTPARRTIATTTDLASYIKADGTVAFTGNQSMGTNKITNLVDPTAAQDAATRAYVLSTAGNYLPLTGGTLTGNLTGRASTTAAGTSPLKLATGVLMTTPEAGAIEYDGTNLYYTNSGGARQTVSTGGGGSSSGTAGHIQYSNGSSGFSSDNTQLFWDATNNRLGIGTSGPSYSIDTTGDLRVQGNDIFAGSGDTDNLTINSNGYIYLNYKDDGASTAGVVIQNNNTNEFVFMDSHIDIADANGSSDANKMPGAGINIEHWSSHVGMNINATASGDGDALIKFNLGNATPNFIIGVDDSDSDKFKISGAATGLGTNDRLVVTSAGSVGIANASPDTTFEVTGGLCVSDATGDSCTTTAGDIRADGAISANAFDLAERYPASENLEPGTIVSLDSLKSVYVKRADVDDSTVVGIVSTDPGLVLGWENNDELKDAPFVSLVAMAGRVPLKVNGQGGAIRIGDLISLSATPGYGMKVSSQSKQVVGVALENFNPKNQFDVGKIRVFVRSQDVSLKSSVESLKAENQSLKARLERLEQLILKK